MTYKISHLLILVVVIILCVNFLQAQTKPSKSSEIINLAGNWGFQIDSLDKGIEEQLINQKFNDEITLPGSMAEYNKGNDVKVDTKWTGAIWNDTWFKDPTYAEYRDPKNIKISFWIQPTKHYVGVAWYQKTINIPKGWENNVAELFIERGHWETTLWVDNIKIAIRNALAVPQIFNISKKILTPGKHTITLRIDNRINEIDLGSDAHSYSDNTQTNWNGVVGKFNLTRKQEVFISDVQVYPDIFENKITAKITVINTANKIINTRLLLSVNSQKGNIAFPPLFKKISLKPDTNFITLSCKMGKKPLLWDEFNPNVYSLSASLIGKQKDKKIVTFGMRSFKANGKQFTVNGKPIFLRGTLECAIFPKTGYPPTDEAAWLRIYKICKAHGLNHIRFHSWCPPEAAFSAADKMGFYLSVEASSWAIFSEGKPVDKFIYDEANRIIKNYGNHTSFCMMAYGNEPRANKHVQFLTDFVKYFKAKDNRRLYTTAAGWPQVPENDFNITPEPRIHQWAAGNNSLINAQPPTSNYDWATINMKWSQPTIAHEIGQWCAYPNFNEMPKYNGVLKSSAFEIFKDRITQNNMVNLADSFVLASGKLQVLCYKAEIEAALRTPNYGGFQLLDLHDFPGQGTALVGILDSFWDSKKYISDKEFRQFCDTTVLLARLPKMIFTNNQNLIAQIEIAHFGQKPLVNVTPQWVITNASGKILLEGKLNKTTIKMGCNTKTGEIKQYLGNIKNPEMLKFTLKINNVTNSWDIFVYPKNNPALADSAILITQMLDENANKVLESGGKVLLTLKKGSVKKGYGSEVEIGFSSIFWNTTWTSGQAPHTLGILCNPQHPALAEFPTQYHSNWQWWDAMSHSNAINLQKISPTLTPIVRVIDDWVTAKPLGLVFECKVGKGSLLVSGIDLLTDQQNRVEAKQLLYSLKKYMAGNGYKPSQNIPNETLQTILNSH